MPQGPSGQLIPPSVSTTQGGTTVSQVLPMSSQPSGQLGAAQVPPVTGTNGPGSQTKPLLDGQVNITLARAVVEVLK